MKQMQWIALFSLMIASDAFAGRLVIDELRKLKASLPANDPSRKEITLRLADRLADEALVSKDKNTSTEKDRLEAIALYQEVVSDRSGEEKNKIQFQLGRLYAEKSDAASLKSAKDLFETVKNNSQVRELKRESIMRLAEFAESSPQTVGQATQYYREALTLCEGTDSCSFSHYRISWIERNRENLPGAIDEMKLALWDSKGNIREEALRDLVSFMGLANGRSDLDIAAIDQLSAKVSRPALLQDLAYAYFSSGNKKDGVKVLSLTHSRAPSLYSEMRLMEEYYGLRQWDQFELVLTQFSESVKQQNALVAVVPAGAIPVAKGAAPAVAKAPANSEKDLIEIEKIGRRLATQLDGERTTDAARYPLFKQFTVSYLDLFPRSPERVKIMEGLVAAEPSSEEKMALIKGWVSSHRYALTSADLITLRELRAAIAQKANQTEITIEEMNALAAIPQAPKVRDYRYAAARAEYSRKNFAAAVPVFTELATLAPGVQPDSLAIQSQNLLLDIYNQQKDLSKLVSQAKLWTDNEALKKNPKLADDLKEMAQVTEQAGFEQAIALGESAEALNVFVQNCEAGKFLPKSCENAKVLAIKLGQHPKLIAVLEIQSKKDPSVLPVLMDEYENGGYFAKAAALHQQLNAKVSPQFSTSVKIALMYELARDNNACNSTLKLMSDQVVRGKIKLTDLEEKACFAFLNDARLLDPALLKVAKTSESKASLAEMLEDQSKGNAQTQQILLSSKTYQGAAWSKHVVAKATTISNEEGKIKFYGRNGQVAFQKRVNRLKELNQFADLYLNGSDAKTRTDLLSILKTSHERISSEIMASPLPANLNEEQVAQIKTSLAEMAKPFQEKADSLQKLLEGESQKVSLTQSSQKAAFDDVGYQQAVSALHQNPKNLSALTALKTIFTNAGLSRPAAYFEGRIQALPAPEPVVQPATVPGVAPVTAVKPSEGITQL